MAGKSCCGGGVPRIDPQDCNALTNGPAGLLVPETEVTGVAANPPGTGTPVDVFVAETDACPHLFQVSAQVVLPAPTLDPNACNAAQNTPDGLLVPQVEVTGVAVNAPGTGTPVDVFVTPTPGCPDQFQVAAEVTLPAGGNVVMPSGQTVMGDVLLHQQPASTRVEVPSSQVTLPEPGTYEITADIAGYAQWFSAGPRSVAVSAYIFDTATGTNVFNAGRRFLSLEDTTSYPALGAPGYLLWGTHTLRALVTITAPTTYAVGVLKSPNSNPDILVAPSNQSGDGVNLVTWRKISD